ncbi:MAG: glycosyltransferase family A protein [Candidatus Celaenobacter antarcticus]|nr:glycosyltransferase family A protein [Candidatus Celaenobacter antarcticus]
MPNVDVIIPIHNCIFIAEAIESVIHQTHKNINIIIIDDGSTDYTKDTIHRFRDLYPCKIDYYYQHQQGPAGARNTGIKKSSNEYIAFLDADDIWLPEKIEKQLLKFKKDPEIGFVYCDNYFIDKSGNIIKN